MITRSGIEVAMHSEPELPVALVVVESGSSVRARRDRVGGEKTGPRGYTAEPGVGNVEAHVEVLGDVPLGARANPPPVPVVVAASRGHCRSASPTSAKAPECAEHGIGLIVIFHFDIAAVDRRPPPRIPEV